MTYQSGEILLGKYRIESLIGQGAFGEVYKVRHLQLKVVRAIKVLRRDAPGVGSSVYNEARQRFELEAQLGAMLNSPTANPYLLQVYDLVISDDLILLEMEYAPGGNLSDRLKLLKEKGEYFSIRSALRAAAEVAAGLAALHAKDIVHRDLKPANILFDEQGHARVADLGLAQIPGGPSRRSQLSNPLSHPGTPGYMSPEQEKSNHILKPPSDIYALGLVLFEMLTGRNYTYLQPETRARSLRSEVPSALDNLLARMLAKSPDDRPWSGEKMWELFKNGGEFEKRPALTWVTGALALSGLAICLLLVVIIIYSLKSWSSPASIASVIPDQTPLVSQTTFSTAPIRTRVVAASKTPTAAPEIPTAEPTFTSLVATEVPIAAPTYVPLPTYTTLPTLTPYPTAIPPSPTSLPVPTMTVTRTARAPFLPHTVTIYTQQTDGEALYRWCNMDWLSCRNTEIGNARWEGLDVSTVGATFDSKNGYTIERAFLFFDTSQIPNIASVTSATLYLYSGRWQNGNKTIHVIPSRAEIPLSPNDYSRIDFISGGNVTFKAPFEWENIPLNSSALEWIIKGGTTRLAIVHENDLWNTAPNETNDLMIATAEDQPHIPYLVINYNSP